MKFFILKIDKIIDKKFYRYIIKIDLQILLCNKVNVYYKI